jgi:hypothetical protein
MERGSGRREQNDKSEGKNHSDQPTNQAAHRKPAGKQISGRVSVIRQILTKTEAGTVQPQPPISAAVSMDLPVRGA